MNEQSTALSNKRYVGVRETLIYGIANGGQCIGYNVMCSQRIFFLLTVFGVNDKAISTMLFVMGFWDAFNDPLMGVVVDKTRTRFGKLRPYLIYVPIFLGIMTMLFFSGPIVLGEEASQRAKVLWMVLTYFLWEFFYTIGDIPFWGLSAAISPNPEDRSRVIKSARLISGIIGGLPNLVITVCIDLCSSGKIPFSLAQVFMFIGIVAGSLGMYLFSLSGTKLKERVVQTNDDPKLSDCFKYLAKNKYLMLITAASLLSFFGGLGGYFTAYFYKLSLGVASLSIFVGIPGTLVNWGTFGFMSKLEKKYSGKQIVVRVYILQIIVAAVIFLLGSRCYTNAVIISILLATKGVFDSFAGAINAVIPTKMIAETVDYMEWKTGERGEGMAFSVLTFVGKLTGSLGSSLAVIVMGWIGLHEVGQDMVLDPNSGVNTNFWMWALITIIPTLLGAVQLIPYIFYDLEGEKLRTIQEEIAVRREENAKKASEA